MELFLTKRWVVDRSTGDQEKKMGLDQTRWSSMMWEGRVKHSKGGWKKRNDVGKVWEVGGENGLEGWNSVKLSVLAKKGQEGWLTDLWLRWCWSLRQMQRWECGKLLSALREESQRPRGHSSCPTIEQRTKELGNKLLRDRRMVQGGERIGDF